MFIFIASFLGTIALAGLGQYLKSAWDRKNAKIRDLQLVVEEYEAQHKYLLENMAKERTGHDEIIDNYEQDFLTYNEQLQIMYKQEVARDNEIVIHRTECLPSYGGMREMAFEGVWTDINPDERAPIYDELFLDRGYLLKTARAQ